MPLTRIDSAFVDLDNLGGITFDEQNGVPTFRVDAVNHRVGIGTNSPVGKLHLSDTNHPLVIDDNSPNVDQGIVFTSGGSNSFSAAIRLTPSGNSNQKGLRFHTGGYVNSAEAVRINPNGNVGIGTNSPTAKLDVNGDALISGLTIGRGGGADEDNTAIGQGALQANTTARWNTAIGSEALYENTTGNKNTASGFQSLYKNTIGGNNVAYGYQALRGNTEGNNNVAIGRRSLYNSTTGSSNICIGRESGITITTGSNNTIIGDIAGTATLSDTVIIAAGTAERLRIDSSGNVGIGTDTPESDQLLTIHGTSNYKAGIRLRQSSTNIFRLQAEGGTGHLYYDLYGVTGSLLGDHVFRVKNSQERLRITSSGKINIGGISSDDDINVVGSGVGARLALIRDSTGNASDGDLLGAISFQSYPTGQSHVSAEAAIKSYAETGQSGSAAPSDLRFFTKANNVGPGGSAEERLRIQSDGDIEFKYNDADTDAEVGASQIPHGLRIYNTNNTLGRLGGIHFSHGGAGTANAGIFHEITNTATNSTTCLGDLVFYTKNSGVSYMTEKFRITSGGNVGIGTINPGAKLDVEGSLIVGTSGSYNGNTNIYGHLIVDRTGVSGSNPWLSINTGGSTVASISGAGFFDTNSGISCHGFTSGTFGNGNDGNSNIYGLLTVDRNGVAGSNTWFQVKNGTTPILHANGSNVGIGTDNLSAKLHVSNTANSILGRFDSNSKRCIDLVSNDTGGHAEIRAYRNTASGTHEQTILIDSNGASYLQGGNVGIGTNNPTSKLHVEGNTSIKNGTLTFNRNTAQSGFQVDGSIAGDFRLVFRDSSDVDRGIFLTSGTAATGVALVGTNTSNRDLGFAPGDTEKVRITSDGYAHFGNSGHGNNKVGGQEISGQNYDTTIKLYDTRSNIWGMQIRRDTNTNPNGIFLRAGNTSSNYSLYVCGTNESVTHLVARGDGNIGIGTNNPGVKLEVRKGGTNSVSGTLFGGGFTQGITAGEPQVCFISSIDNTGNPSGTEAARGGIGFSWASAADRTRFIVGTNSNHAVRFYTNAGEKMRISASGNVGIGTNNPTALLHVNGFTRLQNFSSTRQDGASSFGPGGHIDFLTRGSTSGVGGASGYAALRGRKYTDATNTSLTDVWGITLNGGAYFEDNVGIGTLNPNYKLEVNGSFAATTKSFIIDHPTKPGMKLRHGSLEGPENGVYVRGRSHLEVINLPDYWTGLIDPDSITVTLTPIGPSGAPRVERIENNKVYVFSEDSRPLDYFYMINAERIDVDPLEVEIPE